jgi:hypothetical protein
MQEQEKSLFKASSTSYSQFLSSNEKHVQHFRDSHSISLESEFFRRSITLHYQHVYEAKKCQNVFYRLIFFSFGLFFLALATLIFFKTTNYMYGLYFADSGMIKNGINLCCILFAAGAFGLGYKIHPEREAIRFLANKVEKELNCPDKRMQIEFNAIFANLSHDWTAPHQTLWVNKSCLQSTYSGST